MCITDHPRSRGVYERTLILNGLAVGSSPLARGLHKRDEDGDEIAGIIPARAGFTQPGARGARAEGDHPRSRGVYVASGSHYKACVGSSPLARGLQPRGAPQAPPGGIIPARAGFTRCRGTGATVSRDHPRSRGVYSMARMARRVRRGSSPLARGLLEVWVACPDEGGIIPARAGFTRENEADRAGLPDHPRSRGVYQGTTPHRPSAEGSSPLARGLPGEDVHPCAPMRIIPARAGFTGAGRQCAFAPRDHPRSRGVYINSVYGLTAAKGSSPLARGLHQVRHRHGRALRIIPARAGFTWATITSGTTIIGSSPLARGLRHGVREEVRVHGIIPARAGFTARQSPAAYYAMDHPRSRGVYARAENKGHIDHGSSPLARGLRRDDLVVVQEIRIIPARAGFTEPTTFSVSSVEDHPRSRGVY